MDVLYRAETQEDLYASFRFLNRLVQKSDDLYYKGVLESLSTEDMPKEVQTIFYCIINHNEKDDILEIHPGLKGTEPLENKTFIVDNPTGMFEVFNDYNLII